MKVWSGCGVNSVQVVEMRMRKACANEPITAQDARLDGMRVGK